MNVRVNLVPVGEVNGVKSAALKKTTLVAAKDFKEGDTIYQEKPIVACLDADLIGTGQYCAYCLRVTPKGSAIHAHLDPFHASYCSQECQSSAEEQYESLLFGAVAPATPSNPSPNRTKAQVEERRKLQEKFADQIKESGKINGLLIIRFVGQLLADEHQRLLGKEMNHELPQVDKDSKLTYSFYDYIERLRSIELSPGPQDKIEMELSRDLLKLAVEGLEEFLDEEKYMTFKGKLAYNCFGVTYGAGRTTKPQPTGAPETYERTRAPHGTAHQIGSAFYRVSSYINHSCAPSARPAFHGTSELHLIAARDIKEGEEITVSYVDTKKRSKDKNLFDARKHRRMELARGWGFACDCSRCTEELTTLHIDTEGHNDPTLPTQEVKLEPAVERYLTTE